MDNWTAPKYNFMKHTTVLGGGQFTHSIPLPKREANVQNPHLPQKETLQWLFPGKIHYTTIKSEIYPG